MTVGLILSSAYVQPELIAEFGRIPPCFLPLGTNRLVQRQITEMKEHVDTIFVSLPDDFDIPDRERCEIENRGATILRSAPDLSIGEALSSCVNTIGSYQEPLIIIYGDTLITSLEEIPKDCYSVHATQDLHNWAPAQEFFKVEILPEANSVLSGLFSFSNVPELLRQLAINKGRFLETISSYASEHDVQPLTGGAWHDFGHVQTYFRSNGLVSTARKFNNVRIEATAVWKKSKDIQKINAEATWFEEFPLPMRVFTPHFLGRFSEDDFAGYVIENTYLSTLSSLAVFGELNEDVWGRIFTACCRFLDLALEYKAPKDFNFDAAAYYQEKTITRLEKFAQQGLIAPDKPLNINGVKLPSAFEMSEITAQVIEKAPLPSAALIHGDFCFSNIFFDFRSDTVKLIDPRGLMPNGEVSQYGDPRYDLGKLAHSAQGGYDLIISGRMPARSDGQSLEFDDSAIHTSSWQAMQRAFNASGIAQRARVQTVPLSKPTDGQATTVVEGLRGLPSLPQGPLTIFNVDTIYHDFEHPNFIEDTTCAGYLDVFLGEGSHWSFVEPLDDSSPEGIAERVVEKQRISDLCSTGLYMFQSADLLLSHFDKFASRPANSLQGGERYIAPLYQSLIDTGSVVRYRTVASDKIEFCGTPEEYDALLKSNGWSGEQPDQ